MWFISLTGVAVFLALLLDVGPAEGMIFGIVAGFIAAMLREA